MTPLLRSPWPSWPPWPSSSNGKGFPKRAMAFFNQPLASFEGGQVGEEGHRRGPMASFNILLLSQVLSLKDAKGATGYKEAAPGRERTSADAAEPRNRSFPRPLGEPTYNGRAETP